MNLGFFTAEGDLIGGRIRVTWRFVLAEGETPAAVPAVRLVRKAGDYEYGPEAANLVYSSAAFPPAGLEIGTSRERTAREPGRDLFTTVESAVVKNGREVLRRTTTLASEGGVPRSVEVELVDADSGLTPGMVCYYELRYAASENGQNVERRARASADPGNRWNLGERMYQLLPEMYRRHDVVTPAPDGGRNALAETGAGMGQLRRMMELFGATFDYIRSRTEALRDIDDIDRVDARLLPFHASTIGWPLTLSKGIPQQRHELHYATALYRLTGTKPGCMIWIRRLTGWSARIKEFARNVMFSNDLGNPDDPTDKGSFTVDTENAALLAAMRTFDDQADYTYDAGVGDDSWYSYNTIGIYLLPAAGSTVGQVEEQRGRLKQNLRLFLPVNMRGVVILDLPSMKDALSISFNLSQEEES